MSVDGEHPAGLGCRGSRRWWGTPIYPMLLIGEGTAEIQKMIIGRRLLEEYKAR
jgi:hypothetical protein